MRGGKVVWSLSCLVTLIVTVLCVPTTAWAAPNQALLNLYAKRTDLRTAFDASENYRAVAGTAAGPLIDLEDWARQYGWREDATLSAYAPNDAPERTGTEVEPAVTASSYIVIDRGSGQILSAKKADTVWPIASLTKLMTAQIVLDSGASLAASYPVLSDDDVGGAKLYISSGDKFSLDGLLYATLVGSANNAANAIARASGLARADFIKEMNRRAAAMNLSHTVYTDPTGIETTNVSTARELAAIADLAFSRGDVHRYTTTATASVRDLTQDTVKTIKNTNWMLWKPEYDDIYVMGGKTGYLDESGWNLAVALRPELKDEKRELLVVTFGSGSRAESFQDAEALARWAWKNFK